MCQKKCNCCLDALNELEAKKNKNLINLKENMLIALEMNFLVMLDVKNKTKYCFFYPNGKHSGINFDTKEEAWEGVVTSNIFIIKKALMQ